VLIGRAAAVKLTPAAFILVRRHWRSTPVGCSRLTVAPRGESTALVRGRIPLVGSGSCLADVLADVSALERVLVVPLAGHCA
jgi:hypothetical protein